MIKKFIRLLLGFFLVALGIFLMRQSHLGLNPWGTFHDGVSKLSGLRYGTVTQLTGLVIILLSLILKIKPGVGTILNMILIGQTINLIEILDFIPLANNIILRFVYLIGGLWLLSFGLYYYMTAKLGAGPRDGLMIGLVKLTPFNVTLIKTTIEISALLVGYLLGGAVGVGTIIAALLSGVFLNTILVWRNFDPKLEKHMTLSDFFNTFKQVSE